MLALNSTGTREDSGVRYREASSIDEVPEPSGVYPKYSADIVAKRRWNNAGQNTAPAANNNRGKPRVPLANQNSYNTERETRDSSNRLVRKDYPKMRKFEDE